MTHVLYNFTWDLYCLPWLAPYHWDDRMLMVWRTFVATRLAVIVPVSHVDPLNGGICIYRMRPVPLAHPPDWLPYLPGLQGLFYEVTYPMKCGDAHGSLQAALRLHARIPRVDFITDMVATAYRREGQWKTSWRFFQPGILHGTVGSGNYFKAGTAGVMAGHPDEGFRLIRRSIEINPDSRGDAEEQLSWLHEYMRAGGRR
jgi:hypothetical protein